MTSVCVTAVPPPSMKQIVFLIPMVVIGSLAARLQTLEVRALIRGQAQRRRPDDD